jgi:hypothetical protein
MIYNNFTHIEAAAAASQLNENWLAESNAAPRLNEEALHIWY